MTCNVNTRQLVEVSKKRAVVETSLSLDRGRSGAGTYLGGKLHWRDARQGDLLIREMFAQEMVNSTCRKLQIHPPEVQVRRRSEALQVTVLTLN